MNDQPRVNSFTALEVALLRRRASTLARPVVNAHELASSAELLVARVGAARYAVPLHELASVVPLQRLARIPNAPPWVAGLAHDHGQILTVVDLGALTGERAAEPLRFGLLIEVAGELFALGVPELEGLVKQWAAAADTIPAGVPARARPFIDAIDARGVCRLQMPRLLTELARLSSSQGTPTP
ncbi:MAG: chemotaxis protein CheW [Archangium sp.]|nr:chemotaxis protein CheW [Archangium sp.]MDP3153526.1 chemotaxis protein CheW [Archangium sp.]MDP3574550.1 chemotaxis protein CheW [Archangium sp.]